jgi:murein DD-endopeptidase MepM/ murein hydrolase activator NlpD
MVLLYRRWQRYCERYWVWAVAGAIALWLISGGLTHSPVQAQSAATNQASDPALEQLRAQRDQLNHQLKTQNATDQRFQKAENQGNQRLRDLSKTIQGTDDWISNTEFQLAEAEGRLNQLETDLETNQQVYEQARTAVVGRLQFMQRQQGAQGWALLLQSSNLNDFLDRRYRLKQVYTADRAMLVTLEAQSTEILAQQEGVEQQKNDISLLRQRLMASRAQYTEQMQQQSVMMTRLRDNRGALSAAIKQLDSDSDKVTELILQRVAVVQSAEAKIAREEALRAARSSGKMLMPSQGPITSGFGSRFHPVLGYSRFHAGTDFGAEHGSPIQAAETGIVIFADWYGGYGNAVIIEHGDGITTLYGHASQLTVSEGQMVKKGDVIAAVGTTGLSTGPHLHFEVRQNGEPVDPMGFL